MADFNITDTAHFVIDILDQDGGIKFNTAMVDHNGYIDDISKSELRQVEDAQTNNKRRKGLPITKQDIKNFLITLKDYMELDVFKNGRSYCFKGIYKVKNNKYRINWGS